MRAGLIPKSTQIIGVARSQLTDDAFRDRLSNGIAKKAPEVDPVLGEIPIPFE
jgi:glucose-6-phosphate 1-dehydrogenase